MASALVVSHRMTNHPKAQDLTHPLLTLSPCCGQGRAWRGRLVSTPRGGPGFSHECLFHGCLQKGAWLGLERPRWLPPHAGTSARWAAQPWRPSISPACRGLFSGVAGPLGMVAQGSGEGQREAADPKPGCGAGPGPLPPHSSGQSKSDSREEETDALVTGQRASKYCVVWDS